MSKAIGDGAEAMAGPDDAGPILHSATAAQQVRGRTILDPTLSGVDDCAAVHRGGPWPRLTNLYDGQKETF